MPKRLAQASSPPIPPSPLPAWARPKGETFESVDAAFLAGANLSALDACVRAGAPFAGLWRNRLALRAAVAHARLAGRRESEGELRDGLALGGDAASGPAGGILRGWRRLVHRSTGIDARVLDDVAAAFGLNMGSSWNLPEILR